MPNRYVIQNYYAHPRFDHRLEEFAVKYSSFVHPLNNWFFIADVKWQPDIS